MMISKTVIGDSIYRYKKALVIPFDGKRNVLSTSIWNGGYREDLKWVINKDANPGAGMACTLRTSSYAGDLKLTIEELGLEPEYATAISTAASMDNVSIKTEKYKEYEVCAVVTGGIEVNGGRVGDFSSWDEIESKNKDLKQGTINIILIVNAKLPPGAMTRALVTCTEAKTAALQELIASSKYSNGIATGSGTDSTIIVGNLESHIELTYAGKHSKLGELIGRVVKDAVKEALFKQTRLSPSYQHNFIRRVERFGISIDSIYEKYEEINSELIKYDFYDVIEKISKEDMLVTLTSLYVHLLDQFNWGLISETEAITAGKILLEKISNTNNEKIQCDKGDVVNTMVTEYVDVICNIISKEVRK
ncbi:MAG: adenosylcobinamide amidohydrolase [Eubacteriaceae bacterium]